ncbi:MAG TPA: putative quinol monooxygenase [Allosphingosinicella sp.]|nr:putative quinol monooxygenase [Allosphingosinicella sp.]
MIIVTGTARFGEGEIERLRADFAANIAATRAEDGCEHYAYAVDVSEPNLLHITERWRDEAAIDAHMGSPHMARFMAVLGEAKIEALSIKMYRSEFLKTLLGE